MEQDTIQKRADALQSKVYEQSGGLSRSIIRTPEEIRKAALLKMVRERGY